MCYQDHLLLVILHFLHSANLIIKYYSYQYQHQKNNINKIILKFIKEFFSLQNNKSLFIWHCYVVRKAKLQYFDKLTIKAKSNYCRSI